MLLRSDGRTVACGLRDHGQCNIPPLDDGFFYIRVSASTFHTVLLRSDGTAVACGSNHAGQCSVPPLDEGTFYTEVSTYRFHTVLLRSDGRAVACGRNNYGQCSIPSLKSWRELLTFAAASRCYICNCAPLAKDYVLQLSVSFSDDTAVLRCWNLAGLEVLRLEANAFDLAVETHKRLACELKVCPQSLQAVLPDGQLMALICRENPLAALADLVEVNRDQHNET